jgi:hypothetical protein
MLRLLTDNMVKRAIKVLREEGVKSFWFKLLSEMNCYRRTIFLERSLEVPIAEIKLPLPVAIDLLKENEVDEYVKFRVGASPSRTADRLGAGRLCFVARHEGQIISSAWAAIHRAWIFYLVCQITLAEDEVYFYDAFTKPEFRGQYVSPAIRAEMMRHFRDAGYRRIIISVIPENKVGLQVSLKVGSRPFGIRGYIKIGPWRWDFMTNKRYDSIVMDLVGLATIWAFACGQLWYI